MKKEDATFRVLWLCVVGMAVSVLLAILTGCGTRRQTETDVTYKVRTDTVYLSRTRTDSVLMRDSVYLTEYMRGDTVYVYKYRQAVRWRDRTATDTIYKAVTDTLYRDRETIRTVEKRPKLGASLLALLAAVLCATGYLLGRKDR